MINKINKSVLSEFKPILKTIGDLQYFTYNKIKNLEDSYKKIREVTLENAFLNNSFPNSNKSNLPFLKDETS